jgi:hypothetical protein
VLKKYRGIIQSSGAECGKRKGTPISQVLYFGPHDAPMGLVQLSVVPGIPNLLISEGFTASRPRLLTAFALQHKRCIEVT